MSVTTETPIATSTANGATTVFPHAFTVLAAGDLKVTKTTSGVVTTAVYGVDYSIQGLGTSSGSVTFVTAPANGVVVTRYRDTAIQRLTDYQNNGDLPAATLNADLDRPLLLLQEIYNGGKGTPTSIRVPSGELANVLPSAAARSSRVLAFDSSGQPIAIVGVDSGSAAALAIDLASTASGKGAALVGFIQSGAGTVARTALAKMREAVSALDFTGVDPTGVSDSTAGLQAAIDYVQAVSGDPTGPSFAGGAALGVLVIPAGVYKITSPLVVTNPCVVRGDGIRRTVIRFSTSNNALFAFQIGPTANNTNLIGGSFGGMAIICNAGSVAANGVYMSSAAVGSAVTNFVLHDMVIYNVKNGVSITGVIYMNTFRNITVTGNYGGSVSAYGWYVTSPLEVIYNTFCDLEVTACGNGAYAYYFQVLATQFRNLTADAPCYFSNPYGAVKGLAIEGLSAATVPTTAVVTLNQCDALEDVAIINCPTAKTSIGISVSGRCNISNVRWPDSGAGNQPAAPMLLAVGSKGTVAGYQCNRAPTNLVEAGGTAAADMNSWVFTNCGDITAYDLTYKQGTWTPTFPSGWGPSPTVISAQYTRVGRSVTVTLYAQDGVASAGANIGGLPFAANSTQGAAVSGAGSDTTERICGSIIPSDNKITSIPANTLTGNFWQMTATYFV